MIFFVGLSILLCLVFVWMLWMGNRQLTVEDVLPAAEDDSWDDLEHDQDEADDN